MNISIEEYWDRIKKLNIIMGGGCKHMEYKKLCTAWKASVNVMMNASLNEVILSKANADKKSTEAIIVPISTPKTEVILNYPSDCKNLLEKYIKHVAQCEGVTFISCLNDDMGSDMIFTDEEVSLLESVENDDDFVKWEDKNE